MHQGKCKFPHGHNYLIEIFATGEVDEPTGMVVDFDELKVLSQQFIEPHDHSDLNAYFGDTPTTAENLAAYWLQLLHAYLPAVDKVRVWETDDCYAEVSC